MNLILYYSLWLQNLISERFAHVIKSWSQDPGDRFIPYHVSAFIPLNGVKDIFLSLPINFCHYFESD